MTYTVKDAGFNTVGAQKSMVKSRLYHTSHLGDSTQLVVGEIARDITESLAVAVAAHNRRLADVQRIVKTLFAAMREVDHNATIVHFSNHFLTEIGHAVMCVDALASTVTDGIITIVAQCNIGNTPLRKMLHVANIVFYGKTILNAKHDTLFPLSLVFVELLGMTSKCKVLVV